MRFLPHDQDTGGFFVAVLQKVKPLPPLASISWETMCLSSTAPTPANPQAIVAVKETSPVEDVDPCELPAMTKSETAAPAVVSQTHLPASEKDRKDLQGFFNCTMLFIIES